MPTGAATPWVATQNYAVSNGVTFAGSAFICIQANIGIPTTNTAFWQPALQPGMIVEIGGATPEAVTVKTVAGTKVTLDDGTSFDLTPTTRITHQQKVTVADLKPGAFVAITAKRQTDNTLLASIVSVFSDSQSKTVPPGQRPLPEGNLMTNAAIDQITGNSFTVTFTGGGAKVTIAPDAQILKTTDSTAADIVPGSTV